ATSALSAASALSATSALSAASGLSVTRGLAAAVAGRGGGCCGTLLGRPVDVTEGGAGAPGAVGTRRHGARAGDRVAAVGRPEADQPAHGEPRAPRPDRLRRARALRPGRQ